jgi:N-acetylneuraminic acid mutarotase
VGLQLSSGRYAPRSRLALAVVVLAATASFLASAAAAATPPAGSWQRLPAAPIAPSSSVVSVWTGRQLLIFGRANPDPALPWAVDVAAAYTPATRTWRRLAPFHGPRGNYEGRYWALWSGKEMLVVGPRDRQAFNPATNRWRRLPASAGVPGGIVVWTGRELLGWGGGCCGDASAEGAAYNPAARTRRTLARSPLAPAQQPIGAWTGRELILLVTGNNPANGKPWPAGLARAAAYNPVTDTWRRIAPAPARSLTAKAVWDGREVLVVGGTAGLAYDPGRNVWRRLAPMQSARSQAAMVWTGRRLLVWGGTTSRYTAEKVVTPNRGLAYAPRSDRWSPLPGAPLLGRLDPTAVWTGQKLLVWGGYRPATPAGTGTRPLADGASFASPR